MNRLTANSRSPFLVWLVSGCTLIILGIIVLLARQQLRHRVRDHIANRDAEILHAVLLMQQFQGRNDFGLDTRIEEPADQFAMVLETSRLKGVVAARLFDPTGAFVAAFPESVTRDGLAPGDLALLRQLGRLSRFHETAQLDELFLTQNANDSAATRAVPLLEVSVPIYAPNRPQLLGIAQFIIDGRSIASEFLALDRHLNRQAIIAWLAGWTVITGILVWAFRRLQRANRLLAERTDSLLRANHELSLAAKISAVGGVTAHLIHGLKNPLSGLQHFMANRGSALQDRGEIDWVVAEATTRRMQSLVNEVVRILTEEKGLITYEISLIELVELLRAKIQDLAKDQSVIFQTALRATGILMNRDASLVLLILENLIQNAIQATPPGKTVTLTIQTAGASTAFEVRDQGAGFPSHLRSEIFRPCQSTKDGGSGIGLSICKQLAGQMGAELELISSSGEGCAFALTLKENVVHRA